MSHNILLSLGLWLCLLAFDTEAFAQPDRVRRRGQTGQPETTNQRNNLGPAQADTMLIAKISGTIREADGGAPILGVYVKVKDQMVGAITDANGYFEFTLAPPQADVVLVASYMGYADLTIPVTRATLPIHAQMELNPLSTEEIVVSASRIEERLLEAPITIHSMNAAAVAANPSLNVFEGITRMTGVDQISSSITFRVLNTRGFNSRTNVRMVNRVDGMDMQAPGLNLPVGILNGPSDLDIANVELIPGAASALYGPNAFNGLLNITTKNPFEYQGLSASVKLGANHLDGADYNTSPLTDVNFRYAKAVSQRLAFKLVGRALIARDWVAGSTVDVAQLAGDYANTNNDDPVFLDSLLRNPGYDGLNIYGDEVASNFPLLYPPDPNDPLQEPRFINTRISRDGYTELEVGNPNARAMGLSGAVHYRLSPKTEVSLASQIGTGNTVYTTANRFQIENFITHHHKLELKSKNWFARVYGSFEDAGDSYDTRFSAIGVNRAWKRDQAWFANYLMAFLPLTNASINQFIADPANGIAIGPIAAYNHDVARAFANSNTSVLTDFFASPGFIQSMGGSILSAGQVANLLSGTQAERQAFAQGLVGGSRLLPGSAEFNRVLDSVRAVPLNQNGSKFVDNSWFYHAEAQYDFTPHLNGLVELTAGASFRQFRPNSNGVIFIDSAGASRITVYEYGFYAQARRRFFNDRLAIQASARIDQLQGLDVIPSPRASATYTLGPKRNHSFRATFQSAFRNPTLQAQFINFDVQVFRYIGGNPNIDQRYGLVLEDGTPNAYISASVTDFLNSVENDPAGIGDSSLLKRISHDRVKPERVQAIELGYRANIWNRFIFDIFGYYNSYSDFNETILLTGLDADQVISNGARRLNTADIRAGNTSQYSRYFNSPDDAISYGGSVSIEFALTKRFILNANYTYAEVDGERNVTNRAFATFNTPRHKANFSLMGQRLLKNEALSFNFTYRHVTGYVYGEDDVFFSLPSWNTVDGQVSYHFKPLKTIARLGGTNLLNYRHTEIFAGPRLGALVYFQLNFDQLLN